MKRNLENERCIYQMLPKPVEREMVQFVSKKGEKKNRFVFIEKYTIRHTQSKRSFFKINNNPVCNKFAYFIICDSMS